jgi:hypothetical protein
LDSGHAPYSGSRKHILSQNVSVSILRWGEGNTYSIWRMPPFRMLRHVHLVRIDVSEERRAAIIRVTRIGELGMLAVTSNQLTLWRNMSYFMHALVASYG